jgi:hypothetical protein
LHAPEVHQQRRTRDLRPRQRHGLRHADIDQMLSEPACEIMRADGLAVLSRHHPSQPLGLIERQCGRLDTFGVQDLAELPDDRPVILDGVRFVVGGSKAFRERVQIGIDAGIQIAGHDRGAPCCWSAKDYAELDRRFHKKLFVDVRRSFPLLRGAACAEKGWR